MAKSPEDMAKSMIANMKEKSGKTLPQWVALAKKTGETKHGGIAKFLKTEHGMTHGFANLVAHKTLKSDAGSAASTDDLVAAQYSGAKAELTPIYTRVDLGLNLKSAKAADKLERSGSFNTMVSHRVRLESPKGVNKDVKAWLKQAYSEA